MASGSVAQQVEDGNDAVVVFPRTPWDFFRAATRAAGGTPEAQELMAALVSELEQVHAWAAERGLTLPRFFASREEGLARGWTS